ncbi:protoheme IX biogenesis protein HemY, partial [Yersinia pestis]|uniref:heme biosynthesis HemY N-terminal domain-containing protein n=1 Tax=Yersinia pestis TaxID=632 RepID=UPI001D654BE1
MLRVLLLLLVLTVGIVLGPMLAGHLGYVLIQTDNYNVTPSVTGLAMMVFLLFVAFFIVEWVLRRIFRTG